MRPVPRVVSADVSLWRAAGAAVVLVVVCAATPSLQTPPSKDTLVVNITRADYRESDGTIVLRAAASNATPRDAVIAAAQLAHISLAANGNVQMGYKQTGKIPRFTETIVEAGKARMLEIVSEVDLEDFYRDGLEATLLPERARAQARAGRLVLELRTIDGSGKTHQNFFRIGTVTVFLENGKYVRPAIVINGKSLDGFEQTNFFTQIAAILGTEKWQ